MLHNNAILEYKEYTKKTISYAMVKMESESTPRKIPIYQKEFLNDGRLAIYLNIEDTNPFKITQIQLFNIAGQVWATKTENIVKTAINEGVLYRFIFDISEKEV